VLRADSQVRYAAVREFQRRLEEVGFPGMAYMVNEKHREEDPSFADPEATAPDPLAAEGVVPEASPPAPLASDGTDAMSTPAPPAGDGAQPWQ
jgi:hypothetical protein